jgi:hypothetical protein
VKVACLVLVIKTTIGLTSILSVVIEISYVHTKVEKVWHTWRRCEMATS